MTFLKTTAIISLLALTSCATITGPKRYSVSVSGPSDVKAVYNTREYSLPATIDVKPENQPKITFINKNACYQQKDYIIDTDFRTTPTIFGNILWLLPGFAIDFVTGNAWEVVGSNIQAPELEKFENCSKK